MTLLILSNRIWLSLQDHQGYFLEYNLFTKFVTASASGFVTHKHYSKSKVYLNELVLFLGGFKKIHLPNSTLSCGYIDTAMIS